MSGQFFGERVNNPDGHESAVPVANSPVADLVPYTDSLMVETPSTYETPVKESPLVDDMAVQMAPPSELSEPKLPANGIAASPEAMFDRLESESFRTRWNEIQGKFVDEPKTAVQQADGLVSEVIEQIAQMFAKERTLLEGQWNQSNEMSTEDLRMVLQRYRSFFNRLML